MARFNTSPISIAREGTSLLFKRSRCMMVSPSAEIPYSARPAVAVVEFITSKRDNTMRIVTIPLAGPRIKEKAVAVFPCNSRCYGYIADIQRLAPLCGVATDAQWT